MYLQKVILLQFDNWLDPEHNEGVNNSEEWDFIDEIATDAKPLKKDKQPQNPKTFMSQKTDDFYNLCLRNWASPTKNTRVGQTHVSEFVLYFLFIISTGKTNIYLCFIYQMYQLLIYFMNVRHR